MIGELTGLMTIILLFGAPPVMIILIVYFITRSRHKAKMAMIEKGINVFESEKTENPFHKVLMWGMLLGGIGLGLLIGYILSITLHLEAEKVQPILAILFGGIGLVVYYFYRNKSNNTN